MSRKKNSKKRTSDIMKGIQKGGIDELITTTITPFADGMKEIILEKTGVGDPALESLIDIGSKFMVTLMMAEGFALLGEHFDSDDIGEKSELFARYLRKVAGEKIGSESFHALMASLPAGYSLIKDLKTDELRQALGEPKEEDLVPVNEEDFLKEKVE